MSLLGYDVVNVGDRDLRLGYAEFLKRTEKASFPFVSANVVRRDTKEPVFAPYKIVEATSADGANSIKVGVIGAARYNPLFLKTGPDGSSLVILKGEESIGRYVTELRPQVDLVVLLAALHKEEAKRIVRAAPGIDFVVGSYGGMITTQDELEGSTRLLYAGNQGKRLGETRVYLGDERQVLSAETHLHYLTARYPGDPAMLEHVARVAKQAAIAKKQAAESAAEATGGSPR